MSLRLLHMIFIGASIAMCALVAAWGVGEYRGSASAAGLWLAIACFVLGCGLVVYGVKVYRKLWRLQ